MNAAAFLWKSLLDLARPRSSDRKAGGEPATHGMWLERDWDWHDANLYRQRGQR